MIIAATAIIAVMLVYIITPIVKLIAVFQGYMGGELPDTSFFLKMYTNPLLILQGLADTGILIPVAITVGLISALVYYGLAHADIAGNGAKVRYMADDGTQGTANWMSVGDAKKVLDFGYRPGLLFGLLNNKPVVLPKKSFLNRNVAVFGAPGSMKTRAYVKTNIIHLAQYGESMIITDPKGELTRDTREYLKEMGYNVKTFNLVNMRNSDRWNPLDEIRDDIDAQLFTEVVIANTQISATKSDPFWDRAEKNLLKALILYVVNEYAEADRNLASVYSLIASAEPRLIDMSFKALPNNHPAKMPYNIYMQASETVRTGVIIGLGTRLQVFQNSLVQQLTSVSDIDLARPGQEKCAYFCISSDTDSTFDFLASLFFSFLFIRLTKQADLNGGRLSTEVYFLLDEFPNIGAIPDFTKKISTMRSRGISSSIIFQNIAQLKNRYPYDAWQEIIGSCDSRLFLGCTDIATAEFVSDLLGQATVQSVSHTKEVGLEGLFDFGRKTEGLQKRDLLTPDEILRLPPENAILILRGQKPIMLKKHDFTRHPMAHKLKSVQVSEYQPEWSYAGQAESKTPANNSGQAKADVPPLKPKEKTSAKQTQKRKDPKAIVENVNENNEKKKAKQKAKQDDADTEPEQADSSTKQPQDDKIKDEHAEALLGKLNKDAGNSK